MNQYHSNVTPMLLILAVGYCAAPARVAAQTTFAQDFENMGDVATGQQGPSGLLQEGWIFRNQSSPAGGSPAWLPNGGGGWPNTGNGYLRSTSWSAGLVGATLSNWAILPPIAGLQAGDVFSLWALDGNFPGIDTFIEIRRSPTGGSSTGTGPLDVGDFTEVLFTNELPVGDGPAIYSQIQLTLPGPGRIAIRFRAPNVHSIGGAGANLHLDTLTIGAAPPPPCGLTFPSEGQTVVWDASTNPHTICQDFILPQGSTLQLEPGAIVTFPHSRRLYVDGTIVANGTAAQPVVFQGDNVSGLFVKGSISLSHVDLGCTVSLESGGEATILDSVLRDEAWLSTGYSNTALFMERCDVEAEVFSGAGVSHYDEVQFARPDAFINLGRISKVESVSSVAPIVYVLNGQTRLVENVAVTGVDGPAITIETGALGTADVLLDDSNTLTSNDYPIWIRTSGLHPDSIVPATGNTHNAVLAPHTLGAANNLRNFATLPDVGVPYHVRASAIYNGRVEIPPGVQFLISPGTPIAFRQDNGYHPPVRGLPGMPIRFERLDPAQPWGSVGSIQGIHVFEHLAIDGAVLGVAASGSDIYLRDCHVTDCHWGVKPSAMGIVYGTGNNFSGNDIAVEIDTSSGAWGTFSGIKMDGAERPNVFAGNTIAANNLPAPLDGHYVDDMHLERNWWNHESGPHESFSNPGGQGEEISPFVLYRPWETQPPDHVNHRPVVRLITRLYPVAITGEKIFIEWEVYDDQGITGFDIEVRTPPTFTDPPGWETLASHLPPWTRRYELIVPDREFGAGKQVKFRILAHDATGQAGLEHFWLNIPDQSPPGTVEFHTDLTAGFLFDGRFTLCHTILDTGEVGAAPKLYIDLDGDMRTLSEATLVPGAHGCTDGLDSMPMASTDTARFAIRAEGNNNDDYWYFSDFFEIRPDGRFDDAPPTVSILSPQPGEFFTGGSVIPISWTASDDDFVREYRIQVSLNGGYTYHTIADRLPGTQTTLAWRLPSSNGVADVRIRVVAIDKRFQNSSDMIPVSIIAGMEAVPGDIDGDGAVDLADAARFVGCLAGPGVSSPPAGCTMREFTDCDFDTDADVDLHDFSALMVIFSE